jgi:hypothetical protein
MIEPPSSSDAAPPGAPRWVKVFAIVAVVLVVLLVVLLLVGGHGPSRHGTGASPARSSVAPSA